MKRTAVILIMLLANATLSWGQAEQIEQSSTVNHYAGKTSIDDNYGGIWNVENAVYVNETGEDRKERSVYILRRPSNDYGELADTANCKNRQVSVYPDVRPQNYFSGRKVVSYSAGNGVEIHHRSDSELLIYWWVDRVSGKIKEIAFMFPADSKYTSVKPQIYSRIEDNLKKSFIYLTKKETGRRKTPAISQSNATAQRLPWFNEL